MLRRLTDCRVEYVVIGGMAMVTHGSSHVTGDLDICYSRSQQNIAALVTALAPLDPYLRGAPPGLPFRLDEPTIRAGLNFTLNTKIGPMDLLGEVAGIGGYGQVLAVSEQHTIYGLPVRILSIDGLIAAKKAAGRLQDKLHIAELEELKKLRPDV
jgi:hypothetical protein